MWMWILYILAAIPVLAILVFLVAMVGARLEAGSWEDVFRILRPIEKMPDGVELKTVQAVFTARGVGELGPVNKKLAQEIEDEMSQAIKDLYEQGVPMTDIPAYKNAIADARLRVLNRRDPLPPSEPPDGTTANA